MHNDDFAFSFPFFLDIFHKKRYYKIRRSVSFTRPKGGIGMANTIITISREFGSGGHEIGKQAAERLGIECYDSRLIRMASEKS